MTRSLKKIHFVAYRLLKKNELNTSRRKKIDRYISRNKRKGK